MKINNLPDYAKNYKFIVCSEVDNELWFYGAYNDYNRAIDIAIEIDGMVC